jgi:uncharacterized repeat protein (TIGR03803 family)
MRGSGIVKIVCAVIALCLAMSVASFAQTFNTLFTFDGTNGYKPVTLIQNTQGKLVGNSADGGRYMEGTVLHGAGTVFTLTLSGNEGILYNFCSISLCLDGADPGAPLVQAPNGNYYGTTAFGGAGTTCSLTDGVKILHGGCGTIYQISPSGTLTTLYTFVCSQTGSCPGGWDPTGPLVLGHDGNFYGATYYGGSGSCGALNGCGTIFKVTPTGQFTTLYNFCTVQPCNDGGIPFFGVVVGTNGYLYGVSEPEAAHANGTFFVITPAGQFRILHEFTKAEGTDPISLIAGNDGNFYGTTAYGGPAGGGTVFKFTPSGKLSVLYNFCSPANCADGNEPISPLIQGSDGNFYGTTILGGANSNTTCGFGSVRGCGTLYQVTPSGQFAVLHNFCSEANCADGIGGGEVMQATNGMFYGTSTYGGLAGGCENGCGTIFSLDIGLGPFVATNPGFGHPGYSVNILGMGLTGATAVTFNGTPATTFTVVSDSLIKATVPTGATTGTIQVTTPSGTLASNGPFQLL